MQTFLPYTDFVECAKVLDYRRLGKQRVECLQILNALILPNAKRGWSNHPAVKMWRGYELNLAKYGLAICNEWIERGYKDTCAFKIANVCFQARQPLGYSKFIEWLTPDLCLSHQSNLVRKDSAYYGPKFPDVPDNLPYVWPV